MGHGPSSLFPRVHCQPRTRILVHRRSLGADKEGDNSGLVAKPGSPLIVARPHPAKPPHRYIVQALLRKLRGLAQPVPSTSSQTVSYTHLRAHETDSYLVCRLLLEKK